MVVRSWAWVSLAGMLEVAWAVGLKLSDGFRRPIVSALTVAGMILSFVLLSQGMRRLPVGTAYAVWTGIGSAGTALVGMWLLGEPRSAPRLAYLAMIVAGILGLRLTGG
jgi:quaternary ammonium compound-resistance protein SugE